LRIQIPANGWRPRAYQNRLWNYLENGGKRAVAVYHRRAGKDEVFMHFSNVAAHQRKGNYWHMLPEYAQARKAVWDAINPHTGRRRIDDVFPHELRETTRDDQMIIKLKCGASWQLVGSDNFNSLMGSPPVGVTFSEYALSNPSAWGYIRPILLENGGWAGFNTTPRGHNHAESLYKLAKKEPGWFAELLTARDTGVFTEEQLESERRELISDYGQDYGSSIFRQEYECSFDAAVLGSIWGDLVEASERDGRIGHIAMDKTVPVFTAWDLGFDDDTAIWFFQVVAGEIRFIDYYADSGKDIAHYAAELKNRGYSYGTHWLPHDAKPKTLAGGGRSILAQLIECGVKPATVVPQIGVQDGIQAARKMFPRCYFDEGNCADGLNALRQYQREYDEDKRMFKDRPRHDWTSHAADAFRMAAVMWREQKTKPRELGVTEALQKAHADQLKFGRVRDQHFEARRRAREEMSV